MHVFLWWGISNKKGLNLGATACAKNLRQEVIFPEQKKDQCGRNAEWLEESRKEVRAKFDSIFSATLTVWVLVILKAWERY